MEHLLSVGASVHARDDGGLIALHNACSFGHFEVCSLLLSHGADPNARDSWNYTPLHEAAIKGKIDVCVLLLQVTGLTSHSYCLPDIHSSDHLTVPVAVDDYERLVSFLIGNSL